MMKGKSYFINDERLKALGPDALGILVFVSDVHEEKFLFSGLAELLGFFERLADEYWRSDLASEITDGLDALMVELNPPFTPEMCKKICKAFKWRARVVFFGAVEDEELYDTVFGGRLTLNEIFEWKQIKLEEWKKWTDEELREYFDLYEMGEVVRTYEEMDYIVSRIGGVRARLVNYFFTEEELENMPPPEPFDPDADWEF
jgi:hypothetical protein